MLVPALFAAGGTAVSAAVPAGVAAAGFGAIGGGAAAGAGLSSTLLGLLSAGGSAFSALSSIRAGQARASELKSEARLEEFKARDEYIAGEENAAKLKRELAETIGRQAVAFAAGGVDLGSVSVGVARADVIRDAERELATSANAAQSQMNVRRIRRRMLLERARGVMSEGLLDAGGELGNAALGFMTRG